MIWYNRLKKLFINQKLDFWQKLCMLFCKVQNSEMNSTSKQIFWFYHMIFEPFQDFKECIEVSFHNNEKPSISISIGEIFKMERYNCTRHTVLGPPGYWVIISICVIGHQWFLLVAAITSFFCIHECGNPYIDWVCSLVNPTLVVAAIQAVQHGKSVRLPVSGLLC